MINFQEIKEKTDPILKSYDVKTAGVFGSMARGQDTPDSDIDILVKFSKPKTLLDLIGLEDELTECLHKKVDLVTEGSLSPYIRDGVLKDLQVFYGTR